MRVEMVGGHGERPCRTRDGARAGAAVAPVDCRRVGVGGILGVGVSKGCRKARVLALGRGFDVRRRRNGEGLVGDCNGALDSGGAAAGVADLCRDNERSPGLVRVPPNYREGSSVSADHTRTQRAVTPINLGRELACGARRIEVSERGYNGPREGHRLSRIQGRPGR